MMSQGQLEAIPEVIERAMTALELRVMEDVVERIKANGFVANTAENEIKRLQQLGMTTNQINQYLKDVLKVTDEELEEIFGEKLYEEYFGFQRGYEVLNVDFVPFEDNEELQMLIQAIKQQTKDELRNITNSLGFAIEEKGKVKSVKLTEFYQNTLDTAIYDIQTGVFDYNTVLKRTITAMTKSGLRSINYNSGRSDRIEVAARRAVMTGWRQVQGKINEQVAADLGTDTYEVSRHTGARPSHMVWQGKVWSKKELVSVCGLGEVTGLHGANCYHDYNAFIPGVSVRTYTDEELDRMNKSEMELKTYNGKSYDTYHALQHQRLLERRMRAQRQKISLLVSGGAAEDDILAARCRYQTQMQNYNDYIKKMELPSQMTRVYQDGLSKQRFLPTKKELNKLSDKKINTIKKAEVKKLDEIKISGVTYKVDGKFVKLDFSQKEYDIACLLSTSLNQNVGIVPKVLYPQNISTPDYIIENSKYDLKEPVGKGKNTIYDMVNKKKKQAENFIIDVSNTPLEDEEIKRQINNIYNSKHTDFVNRIILIKNGKIVKIYDRQKKS